MRVLLDENLPVDLATLLEGDHQVATVAGLRWQGVSKGEPLARMEGKFDVLVTMDLGIPYQQAPGGRAISVLGLRARSNRLPDLRGPVPEILAALEGIERGSFRALGA